VLPLYYGPLYSNCTGTQVLANGTTNTTTCGDANLTIVYGQLSAGTYYFPVFTADGVVTAGNASPLSDGASAVVVASSAAVDAHGLRPRARIVGYSVAGVEPSLFGLGPVPAIERLLKETGMSLADVDAIEINEAFAAQVIACERALGVDREKLNPQGGAIALGHPLGSSGSRIVVSLLGHLERTGGQFAIASLCIGVGQGAAMLIERV
jgi:acetyl-CoA acetyltransferase family protein